MRKLVLSAVLVVLICAVTAPLSAAENIATLRFSSLDAVLADVERLSSMSGQTMTREDLLESSLGPLGLGDGAWIDGTRPIVFSLPSSGLMNMGWVGALPVQDAHEAFAALEARLGTPEVDGDLRAFVTALGTTIHVRAVEDYLVFAQLPAAARGAELKQILDVGDLPPGNVALDIDLVPLTAMAQIGMAAGRQGVEDSLELEETDTTGRAATMGMYDLYVGVVNAMLLTSRRIQLSVEAGSEYLKIHKWLLPRADSTLARLLKAQKSGFPDIARQIDAESAVMVVAVGIDLTDGFRAALKEFSTEYTKVMGEMGQSVSGDEAAGFLALMSPWAKMADKWIDCARGDSVGSYEFGAETGFRLIQMAGMTDGEGCGELLDDVAEALAGIPETSDGRSLVVVTEQALVYSGVQATRVEFDLVGLGTGLEDQGTDSDEEDMEFIQKMLGADGYVSYMGMKNNLLVSTSGAGAEQAFKEIVDGLSTKKKKRGRMTPKQFEPLKVGAGMFGAVDVAKILHELAKLDPDDEDLQGLDALADQAGRWVFGTHLDPEALRVELSMPLSALHVFAALDDDDGHEHDDGDGHQHDDGDEHDGDDDQYHHAEEHGD